MNKGIRSFWVTLAAAALVMAATGGIYYWTKQAGLSWAAGLCFGVVFILGWARVYYTMDDN